jgi:hypothetical protein
MKTKYVQVDNVIKGSLTRDFLSSGFFFINQIPPGPEYWGLLEFLRKFAEILESKG